jgi:hypothetical protein
VQKHDYSAKRGEICGFSAKARQRMLWTANKTDFTGYQGIYFATLTYHHNWTERDYRRDRENYLKRLRRLYPEAQFIWRLEPQRRGAPHFHILVILPCADTTVCEALEAHWHELVDKGNVHHKKHGAKVASLESGYTGVKIYLSKYSAKVDASGAAVQLKGRQWGKSRGWPTTPQQEAVLDSRSEVQLRRFLRGLMIARHNRSSLYAKTVVQGHTSKVWLDKDSEVAAVRRYIAVLQKGGFHPV